jgi:hypothetical protein
VRQLRDERERFRAVVALLDTKGRTIGSGFFAGDGGLILTAAHVLDAFGELPDEVQVALYVGETERMVCVAEVVHGFFLVEEGTDLALLRLREPPTGALWLAPGASSRCGQAVGFGYPEQLRGGLAIDAKVHSRVPGEPRLQLTCEQITHGHSGGPLIDGRYGVVIAVVHSILGIDTGTLKRENECFAVPIEHAAAALAEAYVRRAEDEEADALVARWVEQVSRAVGPRSTWRNDPVECGTPPALTDVDVAALRRLVLEVEESLAGEVLWRLSGGVLAEVRAEVRTGRDWREATFDACRTNTALLRVLAAALCDAEASVGEAFDTAVQRGLQLRHGEQGLRVHADTLRDVPFEVLLELVVAAGCTDVQWLKVIPENRDRVLYLVRWLASARDDVLVRIVQQSQRWQGEADPAAEVATVAGCSLVVAVELNTGGGIRAGFWGIPHGAGEQRNLGSWDGASLADRGLHAALNEAERQLRNTWSVTTEQVFVEFALPRELFAEAVEGWQFQRTSRIREALGVAYPVVLRSTDRLYDSELQRLWDDWKTNWDAFHAAPVLRWLKDPAEARRHGLRRAGGVGLRFTHTPDSQDEEDPVMLCIDNMVPVALWWRPSGSGAVDPEPEDLLALPAWVWARRQADEGADDSVVLMWDDPRRIPSNARQQRENLARRTVA